MIYPSKLYYCDIQTLLEHIISQFLATTLVEWIAFAFGLLQVILAWKNKTSNFYAGILSVSMYSYVFYRYHLFAESILNVYYFLASVAGIFWWNKQQQTSISRTTAIEWKKSVAIALFAFFVLLIVLTTFTDSTVPYADAAVTAIAWTGTWLLLKRKLENWLVLNLSNLIAVPLQLYKGLVLTSVLTLVYIIIGMVGYYSWKKIINRT